jgi:hypothetical protein
MAPVSYEQILELIKQQKYAFFSFSSELFLKHGSSLAWYILPTGRWQYVRFLLEAFGPQFVHEHAQGRRSLVNYTPRVPPNEVLRGIQVWAQKGHEILPLEIFQHGSPCVQRENSILYETELQGTSWVLPNMMICLVRWPMPWGAKAFLPLEERREYVLAEHQAELDPDEERLQKRVSRMKQQYETEDFHAMDRPIHMERFHGPLRNVRGSNVPHGSNVCYYSVPPKTYVCHTCKRYGHHFMDACFLFGGPFETAEEAADDKTTKAPVALPMIWSTKRYTKL